MSTAVAMAPSPAPHDRDRSTFGSEHHPPAASSSTASPSAQRTTAVPPPAPAAAATGSPNAPTASAPPAARSASDSPRSSAQTATSARKPSPPSASRNASAPKILVKKEPESPDMPAGRHRPRKLDLSKNTTNIVSPATARPLTARDGPLGIQEIGLACLSPGLTTQDPVMKEQLQRSLAVREQQRQIIETRLQQQQQQQKDGDKDKNGSHFTAKTPGLARKRGAPPGLSIVAPSHEQFANERVIQSAPLGQTFTGRYDTHSATRHITNQPSHLGHTSHIHHVPANQTNNRLPPLADVFGRDLPSHRESNSHLTARDYREPLPSPHHPPPPPQAPLSARREYKTAEEAQHELAGGRPELLPKLVRYGGHHQPPTPPSPPHHASAQPPRDQPPQSTGYSAHDHTHSYSSSSSAQPPRQSYADPHASRAPPSSTAAANPPPPHLSASSTAAPHHGATTPLHPGMGAASAPSSSVGSKRRRDEYEAGSPPLGNGRPAVQPRRYGPFGEGRDSPETMEAKKQEFLRLCERAWDLFHS